MNCPNCNYKNAEMGSVVFKGKDIDVLANFCAKCGTDLRPCHEEWMKTSSLRPEPAEVKFVG
jgi:hypothetical protein